MKPAKTRDERVGRMALGLGVGGGLLSMIGALTLHFGQQAQVGWVRGFGMGVLAALPFFFAVMTLRAVRTMDEYGQQLHMRAAALAFLLVMVLAGTLISLEAMLGFHTPAWAYYTAGMLIWSVTAAVLSARHGRGA